MEDKKKLILIGGGVLVLLIFVIAFFASGGSDEAPLGTDAEVLAEPPLAGDESEVQNVEYEKVGKNLIAKTKTKADERDFESVDWGDDNSISVSTQEFNTLEPQTLIEQDIITITNPEVYLYNPTENYYMLPLSVAKEHGVDFSLAVDGGESYISLGNNLVVKVDGNTHNFKYSIPGVYNIAVTNQNGPITKKSKTILLRVGQVQASYRDSTDKNDPGRGTVLMPILLKAKAETPVGQILQYYWTCDVLSSSEVSSCDDAIYTDSSTIEALTGAREDTDNLAALRFGGVGAYKISLQVQTNLGFASDVFSRVYRIAPESIK